MRHNTSCVVFEVGALSAYHVASWANRSPGRENGNPEILVARKARKSGGELKKL